MDLSLLKYTIELFLLSGPFHLAENEHPLGEIQPHQIAVEISFGKLILTCWTDAWTKSWRVVGCTPGETALSIECVKNFGRTACTLILRRGVGTPDAARTRGEYTSNLSRLIQSRFPSICVQRASVGRVDHRHLRGVHTRLIMNYGHTTAAGIAIGDFETQPVIDSVLAGGIVWVQLLRKRYRSVDHLMIFAPRGRTRTISTRLCAVNPRMARISLFEIENRDGTLEPVGGFDQGDLIDRIRKVSHRSGRRADWPALHNIEPQVQALINSVTILAPHDIEIHHRGASVLMSIRGLEFARISTRSGRAEFGLGVAKTRLNSENRRELADLVDAIVVRRIADSRHRVDMFYRAQAERWLESIILGGVSAIDSSLDGRYVYSQVPAYRGEQRGYIDILTVTRSGRLVVVELKVAEDPDFPFQALDYWLRVEWHRRRGDFERRGYFAGNLLQDQPPLLYLVAPLFRFHATTGLISSWISKQVPVYRIGINEDWRRGVKVLLTERLN